MKLTAYDLARDKSAILAAVLESTAPPGPVKQKAPKKPVSKETARRIAQYTKSDEMRERALRVLEMIELGFTRAAIIKELGLTVNQYTAAIKHGRTNGIIADGVNAKSPYHVDLTDELIRDLQLLRSKAIEAKYGMSGRTITRLRAELTATNTIRVKPGRELRWTREKVSELMEQRAAGVTLRELGKRHGKSWKTIQYVLKSAESRGYGACKPE